MTDRVTGGEWLAHDVEKRRAIALKLREQMLARQRGSAEETAAFLFAEFQLVDKKLRDYECVDSPQEACNRETAVLAELLNDLCENIGAHECTEAGVSSGIIAFLDDANSQFDLQSQIDLYQCATQLETLDRVARKASGCPVVQTALMSCGWNNPAECWGYCDCIQI